MTKRNFKDALKVLSLLFLGLFTAAAIIKSGATSDLWSVDPTSKAGRVTIYDTAGTALTQKITYHATYKAAIPVASATSPFVVIQGSATKTIRIHRFRVTYTATTGSATATDVWSSKFTTISGGTTGTAPTIAKADSNDGTATATVFLYTAVPSTATQADGFWTADRTHVLTEAATTGLAPTPIDWVFGVESELRPLVLRGTAQYFGIGITALGTTPIVDIMVAWTEE